MIHIKSLSELHRVCGIPPPEHPMLSIYRFDAPPLIFPKDINAFTGNFFQIALKRVKSGLFLYGRTKYDHSNGTMSFIKPGQLVELRNVEFEEKGFVISFHSDFIKGHTLHNEIKKYGFFEYEVNEALHLSPSEETIMYGLYRKIEIEYFNNQDEFSIEIILSHISSMLKYAQRFYKRQFINRRETSGKLLSRFNKALSEYFESGRLETKGLPDVNHIADNLNISPRYLSDLLKVQTGKTAIEHIHIYLIEAAKNLLLGSENSISETAYKLGFEYAPYFSRLFKKKVGISPKEFRKNHILNRMVLGFSGQPGR